jgi:ATP-dependent Clp protease, protease subunit
MRQWFTMKADDKDAEIIIYDEIGQSFWNEDSIGAKQFIDDLAALGDVENITLRINSPGGDVFDGVAIHNALKNHNAKITAHVDGIAASIASYIAMAANRIVMPSNAFMLIHNAQGFVMGTAEDMRAIADDLDRIDKSIVATYATRSGSKRDQIKQIMKEDRLMDAKEAKALGLADEVVAETKLAANFSLRLLPAAAAERFRAETGAGPGDPPPLPEPETAEAPVTEPPPSLPPLPSPIQVVDERPVEDLKKQGADEHKAYVSAITDLCALAGRPERVGNYVRAGTSIEGVRKELLELRASADVLPQHPLAKPEPPGVAWDKITEKLNARRQ